MLTLIYKTHFDAAHVLPDYPGPCGRLHGHRWGVDVEIAGPVGNKFSGMMMDFKDLKAIVEPLLPDHRFINEWGEFKDFPPTAENLVIFLFYEIKKKMPVGYRLESLTLWESENAGARHAES